MKKTLAVTVAVVFVLAFAAPVFAQSMDHNATYKMDGSIDLEKQVGHLCNTGAEMKQTIHGEGVMDKVMDTRQVQGVLTVSDEQDWVTAEDAVRNLTVTSVIELCAPPKTEATATDFVYNEDLGWLPLDSEDYIPSASELYTDGLDDVTLRSIALEHHPEKAAEIAGMTNAQLRAAYAEGHFDELGEDEVLGYSTLEFEGLTDQIWAVQVEADPGFSGNLHQDFEAAYGPYEGWLGDGPTPAPFTYEGDDEYAAVHDDGFGFRLDEDGYVIVEKGDDYVGNYFNIDQMARTSQGTVRRYIDISSPFSHAYLYEDMEVVGMAEIEESFVMDNLEPGEEATPDWWDLF